MIGVQKNGEVEFLSQTSHESRNWTSSHKGAFAFRQADQNRQVQFPGGGEHRF